MSINKTIIGLSISLLMISFLPGAMAQDDENLLMVDGKLWNVSGDTIYGKLLYINQFSYQLNVTLIDSGGTPAQLFSPKDIDGFIYYINKESYEFRSMVNPSDLGRLFLRVVYKGKYTIFQFLEINLQSTVISYNVSYYLWNNKWLYPPITQQLEKESLLHHFSDCPELEFKIKSGTYGLSQIRLIINEYEQCKLTDEYEYFFE